MLYQILIDPNEGDRLDDKLDDYKRFPTEILHFIENGKIVSRAILLSITYEGRNVRYTYEYVDESLL